MVQTRSELDNDGLQSLLYGLESGRPLTIVDSLNVRRTAQADNVMLDAKQSPRLTVELRVVGFYRKQPNELGPCVLSAMLFAVSGLAPLRLRKITTLWPRSGPARRSRRPARAPGRPSRMFRRLRQTRAQRRREANQPCRRSTTSPQPASGLCSARRGGRRRSSRACRRRPRSRTRPRCHLNLSASLRGEMSMPRSSATPTRRRNRASRRVGKIGNWSVEDISGRAVVLRGADKRVRMRLFNESAAPGIR